MKTKAQKQEEVKKGEELLNQSEALVFVDIGKVKTADLRNLRRELKAIGNPLFVIKKRLLNLIFKGKNLAFNDREFKTSVGTVFASNLESAAQAIYKFFRALEKEKKIDTPKILGGYDLNDKTPLALERVLMIGKLLPREVLLAQLFGMIAAPIKSLLYVLDQKSKTR